MTTSALSQVVVRAPAKLNLFLELIRKRADGFHDIDTVMVPINRFDTLVIKSRPEPGIRIQTDWWPSRQIWAEALGEANVTTLLAIPDDQRNLIHRAIDATMALSGWKGGFEVSVRKRIPAGAGMGGASSDAAATIRAVAALTGLSADDARLPQIAAEIGSDVPFFLGNSTPGSVPSRNDIARLTEPTHHAFERKSVTGSVTAMRATGRGEILSSLKLARPLRFIVAYPATALATAKVYSESKIPENSATAMPLMNAMQQGDIEGMGHAMCNRLSEPAIKISTLVKDLLELMWQAGLPRCQLTGSGSACYSLLDDSSDILALQKRLSTTLNASNIPAIVFAARSISIPQRIRTTNQLQTSH